jgi:hypothetical protein
MAQPRVKSDHSPPVSEEDTTSSAFIAAQADRRAGQRLITILRVGKMICARNQELCLIRNISEGGLMAHVYSPHEVGDKVVIELKSDHCVAGTIGWVQDDNVGIVFDERIDVKEILRNRGSEDGRKLRAPRLDVRGYARLRIGADTWRVEVSDLSQGGAKVKVDGYLPLDEDAVVTIDGLRPVKAVIRWQEDEYVGLEFLPLIPLDELVHWLDLRRERDHGRD